MESKHYFLLIFLSLIIISEQKAISPDSKRLYHDIVSGHGLYYGFDKFNELNSTNFKNMVFNKSNPKLWLVEFYNSWCGHCHRFAPTWKSLAADIYGWRHLVALSAVDCSKDENNQLCRDYEVMYYPMIKLFPPLSSESFLGTEFNKGNVGAMRRGIINELRSIQADQAGLTIPNFKPYNGNNLEGLWTDIPMEVLYTVAIVEPNDSYTCAELAMDFSRAQEVQIRCVSKDNKAVSSIVGYNVDDASNAVGVFAFKRDLQVQALPVSNSTDRNSLIKTIKDYFNNKGIVLTVELPSVDVGSGSDVDITDVMSVMQWEDEIKKKLNTNQLSSIVFQLDLEGAIGYSLKNEIPLHKNITGDALVALKNYINVLVKYFPIGRQGVKLFTKIKDEVIGNKSEVKGKEFRESVKKFEEELHPVFLPNQGWLGCRGSKMEFRGYPCGLWTMFHTLTVSAAVKNSEQQGGKGSEVLDAMAGYVKYFFTCSDCSQHFQQMAVTIAGNVSTYEDSILWLWASHNKVNARLAGDQTEDPEHKKVQFPTFEACSQCRDENGQFKPDTVLQFLKSMYSNISYLQIDAMSPATGADDVKYSKNLKHEHVGLDNEYDAKTIVVNKSKRLSWDFNIFDISLCVFLYICSVAILIVVCIKFVFKRTYRKKTYVFDLLSKV